MQCIDAICSNSFKSAFLLNEMISASFYYLLSIHYVSDISQELHSLARSDFLPYPKFRKLIKNPKRFCHMYFHYDQCAGPQKQEDINGHSSTIVGQKIKVSDVFQSGNQGIFLVLNKKIWKKKFAFFFNLNWPMTAKNIFF